MLDSLNCSVLPADSSLESKPPLWSAQQRYTVQIIQLVECQPPPRRISIDNPSFASSSSCHSSPESTSSSSIDEESLCSSYCSSDDGAGVSPPLKDEVMEDARMVTRILAWRQNFSSHLPTVAGTYALHTLLRSLPHSLFPPDASLTLSSKQQRDSDYHNNDHDVSRESFVVIDPASCFCRIGNCFKAI